MDTFNVKFKGKRGGKKSSIILECLKEVWNDPLGGKRIWKKAMKRLYFANAKKVRTKRIKKQIDN